MIVLVDNMHIVALRQSCGRIFRFPDKSRGQWVLRFEPQQITFLYFVLLIIAGVMVMKPLNFLQKNKIQNFTFRDDRNMKGQLSAEMLILIVVVLAVVALVASQLMKTGEETSKAIEESSGKIINATEVNLKKSAGASCTENKECKSDYCSTDDTCG